MKMLMLLAILVLPGTGSAQAPLPLIRAGHVREGRLSFDGRATTGDFTGVTTTVRGEMTGGATLAEVRGWVEAPVQSLVTGNGKRDKDLNKSMESGTYPVIRFNLTGCTPRAESGDGAAVTLTGQFAIHGVTRDASIPATLEMRPDGIRVHGDVPLNLKDYRIGGLTKMLGILKMDENILVHIDVTFAPDSL
jgi:polyisoprenoid-binding protein YceI